MGKRRLRHFACLGFMVALLSLCQGCAVVGAAGLIIDVAKLGVETATAGVKITAGAAKLTFDAAGAVIGANKKDDLHDGDDENNVDGKDKDKGKGNNQIANATQD